MDMARDYEVLVGPAHASSFHMIFQFERFMYCWDCMGIQTLPKVSSRFQDGEFSW
jgi:hypothetical protein